MDFFVFHEELHGLFRTLQTKQLPLVEADWEFTEENPEPFVRVTIGFNKELVNGDIEWDYQTGSNDYSGGASRFAEWSVVDILAATDCCELAFDVCREIKGRLHGESDEIGLLWELHADQYNMNTQYASADRWFCANNLIWRFDPYDGARIDKVSFFLSEDLNVVDMPQDHFALIAEVAEDTSSPEAAYSQHSLKTHYLLGTFPGGGHRPLDPHLTSVKWAAEFSLYAFKAFKRDRHFSACPSSERMDWVDEKFNPIPQKSLPDPDIGGVW